MVTGYVGTMNFIPIVKKKFREIKGKFVALELHLISTRAQQVDFYSRTRKNDRLAIPIRTYTGKKSVVPKKDAETKKHNNY